MVFTLLDDRDQLYYFFSMKLRPSLISGSTKARLLISDYALDNRENMQKRFSRCLNIGNYFYFSIAVFLAMPKKVKRRSKSILYCSANNCRRTNASNPQLSFHRFPSEASR